VIYLDVAHRQGLQCCGRPSALALRAALRRPEPIPQPTIPDEFSYLLMSDTRAGRLTTPHIRCRFTWSAWRKSTADYVSKYFAGQVFSAFSQHSLQPPFWGVWLSVASCAQ
jgi:hypothetical protein